MIDYYEILEIGNVLKTQDLNKQYDPAVFWIDKKKGFTVFAPAIGLTFWEWVDDKHKTFNEHIAELLQEGLNIQFFDGRMLKEAINLARSERTRG